MPVLCRHQNISDGQFSRAPVAPSGEHATATPAHSPELGGWVEINALLARSGFAALPLEGRLEEPNPQMLRSVMAQVSRAIAC